MPVFLPGESHGQISLAGYSPWGHKESNTTDAWITMQTRSWESGTHRTCHDHLVSEQLTWQLLKMFWPQDLVPAHCTHPASLGQVKVWVYSNYLSQEEAGSPHRSPSTPFSFSYHCASPGHHWSPPSCNTHHLHQRLTPALCPHCFPVWPLLTGFS